MNNNFTRRDMLRIASVGAAAATVASPAILRAQSGYPDRPINVVIPFDTGGYNDRLARASAPFLQEALGQPLNMINRGGAGALLGHTFFMQQPDDGYTISCSSFGPYVPLNILTQDAPFTVDDFHMINLPSQDYTLMATAADSDIQDAADVIARLQENPGSLSIGIQPASADLVNLMLLLDAHGIERDAVRLVTYDGGGPARNAAAGGVVDIALVGGQGFLPLREQIRPVLVFDEVDNDDWGGDLITDVSGADAEFVYGSQRGWGVHSSFVEKHPDRYEILLNAIETASKSPEMIESLTNQQLATDWRGPEVSNRALRNTAAVMEQHIDLLAGT
ncbi:Bug family tripartite tricarboxylate transporter substrate binding protein [Alkalilacustris brevis]|uniref:Bug family tripartite tricarboxylate transporter substrate binding protein n=1 Tax=Alkalilacustris brevis TaxID=2026338 RepID=UPI000E0DB508|nr:tripartite tricarboxylate transporter substrate-binding protein [Alkalilacustris brevis]